MVKVVIETGVIDSIYIDVSVGAGKRFSEEGIILLGVYGMGRVEVIQLVAGFKNSQGLPGPVDGRICGIEPRESKDDVLLVIAHDIEEIFLDSLFNVYVEVIVFSHN